jgi:hypothetical protein
MTFVPCAAHLALLAKVDLWNRANPIGTRVMYRDDLGNHTAVIWLERKTGCVALDRVTASAKETA